MGVGASVVAYQSRVREAFVAIDVADKSSTLEFDGLVGTLSGRSLDSLPYGHYATSIAYDQLIVDKERLYEWL